jgi:CxxC motif-containing protein (DUF1111 family)
VRALPDGEPILANHEKPKENYRMVRIFKTRKIILSSVFASLLLIVGLTEAIGQGSAPKQPPVRNPSLAQPLPGLSPLLFDIFSQGNSEIGALFQIQQGLGPNYNAPGCASCHGGPFFGAASPAINPLGPTGIARNFNGAINEVPSEETTNGPALQFLATDNTIAGYETGQVIPIYTITGMQGAGTCSISQPNFAALPGHVTFRQPTQLMGLGLIEAIPPTTLQQNLNNLSSENKALGISGVLNVLADGSIGYFGQKAQIRSLFEFDALAMFREMGPTTTIFPTKHAPNDTTGACSNINAHPEDGDFSQQVGVPPQSTSMSATELITYWIRLTQVPAPQTTGLPPDWALGQTLFQRVKLGGIGCANCHTVQLTTGNNSIATQLSGQTIALYSDVALHGLGSCDSDGLTQGTAGPGKWRTTPLIGVGSKFNYMHNGRATTFDAAVQDHFCVAGGGFPASEANAVVNKYNVLPLASKQALVDFLGTL